MDQAFIIDFAMDSIKTTLLLSYSAASTFVKLLLNAMTSSAANGYTIPTPPKRPNTSVSPFLKMCASRPGVETKASAYNVIVTSDLNTTTSYQYLKAAVTPCATSNCFAKRVPDKKAILYKVGLSAITRWAGRSILQILPRNRAALITLTHQPLCRSIATQPFTSFSVGISRREGRRD